MSANATTPPRPAEPTKVERYLYKCLRVLLDALKPPGWIGGHYDLVGQFTDTWGDQFEARLSVGGVLTVHKNGELVARSAPIVLNAPVKADPKFKPPRWLV